MSKEWRITTPTAGNNEPTPGEWKVVPPGHGHPTEYLCVQFGEDETYTTLEIRPADARLIAAAKDLLAALKAVQREWMGCPFCGTDGTRRCNCTEESCPTGDLVRAAIAKATGQAPCE